MGCLKFIVKGKVQGVWYRKYTSKNFNKDGFIGYVRNLDDGTVEVVIKDSGNIDTKKIFHILEKGSPNSVVEEILTQKCSEDIEFKNSFEVRY